MVLVQIIEEFIRGWGTGGEPFLKGSLVIKCHVEPNADQASHECVC